MNIAKLQMNKKIKKKEITWENRKYKTKQAEKSKYISNTRNDERYQFKKIIRGREGGRKKNCFQV